eukprot:COSAG01_NODE_1436_length_10312_cov_12.469500_10_plen_71_part_00
MCLQGLDDSKISIPDATAAPAEDYSKMTSQDYLAKFELEKNLEELINVVLKERPQNPYAKMAEFLEGIKI